MPVRAWHSLMQPENDTYVPLLLLFQAKAKVLASGYNTTFTSEELSTGKT